MLFGFNGISQTKNSKKKLNEAINTTTSKNKKNVIDNADIDANLKQRIKQALKENAQTLRFMENKGQIAYKDILYYFDGTNGSAYIENRTQEIR